ncbi:EAL domain-containing protein [Roseibium sp.]|uniref:bifunctional diguanylate cyclase/phosphodiesterase n=1 Tax=Roseibium sp. TaxID=1936156 RepID=UPI003A970CEB
MDRGVQPIIKATAESNGHARGFTARLDAVMRHWSKNGKQISRPLQTTFLCFFFLTLAILIGQNFLSEYRHLQQNIENTVATAKSFLKHEERSTAAGLEKALLGISANQALANAYISGDRASLLEVASSIFPEMEERHQISEFSIYDPRLNRVASAHARQTGASNSPNFLVSAAATSTASASGIEMGDAGTNIIAAVRPWTVNGHLIGYLKLGTEIRGPLGFIGNTLGAKLIEVHDIDHLPPGTEVADAEEGWTATGRIVYRPVGDFAVPSRITGFLSDDPQSVSQSNRIFLDKSSVRVAYTFPLDHADGSRGAYLVLMQDITGTVVASLRHSFALLLLACVITAIAGYVMLRLVRSLQSSMLKTRQKLEQAVETNNRALHHSEERLVEAQRIASLGSWERDLDTNELFWSKEMYRIAGLPETVPANAARRKFYDLIPPCERPYVETEMELAIKECRNFNFEHQVIRANGEVRRVHVRGYVIADKYGKPSKVLGTTHDITAHHNTKTRSNQMAAILEDSLNEIYIFDTETLIYEYANKCARDNVGYSAEEISKLPAWDIVSSKDKARLRQSLQSLLDGSSNVLHVEGSHRRKDGSEYPVEVRIQVHRQQTHASFVAICNDITDRKNREQETQSAREAAERIAYFDELTGLPNRAACQRDAERLFAEDIAAKPAFIIHLDIDNFKRINDTLGHSAGDACLQEAGERLKLCCIGLGEAYRWGGDEFVILALDETANAEELCQRLNIVMRGPMEYDGKQIFPSVSIGVAKCPDDGHDFSTLLVHADLALYRSKEDGKDRWSFFTSDMKIDSDDEARTEQELRQALRRDEFFLVFQPQVNIRTQQVTGIEALVRWQHPTRGVLGPGAFLPVIEKTSLATPLGQVVIDKALAAARAWQDANIEFGRVAVNLSPSHLTSGTLVTDFTSAMQRYDVSPEYVTAEVLESVFLDSERGNNSEVLETLHKLGVHIELDDFGTGYASLSHVADLPINGLKIDRSFTAKILTDAKKEIVVNHLIHLARSLDIDIVCEGVETISQFDRLRMMGNFSVQGYYIARPMPYDMITDWLSTTQNDISFEAI